MILLKWLYRVLLLLIMMACVYGFSALPLPLKSLECAVTLGAYMLLVISLQSVYRATDVGMVSVTELVMSQMLSNLISAGVVYVGVALYVHHAFCALPLLCVVLLQTCVSMIWSICANSFFFRKRRRSRTAIIHNGEASLNMLLASPYFSKKYDVITLIENPEDDIAALQQQLAGCEVVFTIGIPATLTNGIAKLCLQMGVVGYFMPQLGHIIMNGAVYSPRFSVPMLRVQRAGGHSEYRLCKRAFDLCASLIGAVLASPIMLATAIAIKLEDRGPVFYRQVRLTRNGREFNILKFRSMKVNAEADGVARRAQENDSRITRVGRFIRACRIDELPQLINIIRGDMSIVGPRPERPEIAEQYQKELPEFALRLQVKAGLTGLAQVYGRYNTEPYHKLQMDLMYINEMSLLKDFQLILATIKILFVKESTQGFTQGRIDPMEEESTIQAHRSA